MNAFDLIIFDFDGTIVDSASGIAQCMAAAFERHHLPPPLSSDVRARIGLTLEESIRQLTDGLSDLDVAALARHYRELHASVAAPAIALFPGATETLAALVTDHRLVVVSQKARRGLLQLMGQLDIERYFDLVLGSDDVTALKPDAALYERHIAPRYPVARTRILVVGDTATDLHFAANIGASGCWAEYGYGDERRCRALSPVYTVADITEVTSVCAISPAGPRLVSRP